MTRFALTIEYDGADYMGWQRQSHGPSIQEAIETAIAGITGTAATVYGAGRTDAGVHARGMVAHVDIDRPITPFRLSEAINARLRPQPVAIISAAVAADDWHARYSCTARAYEYVIVNRRAPLTFDRHKAWRLSPALDADAMHEAAQQLIGQHDFTTFRSVHCQSASPVKTLSALSVRRNGNRVIVAARARSFLHHQVRSIVGCLALVGQGKWRAETLKAALNARDRAALGLNAPPDGLFFVEACYEPGSAEQPVQRSIEHDHLPQ